MRKSLENINDASTRTVVSDGKEAAAFKSNVILFPKGNKPPARYNLNRNHGRGFEYMVYEVHPKIKFWEKGISQEYFKEIGRFRILNRNEEIALIKLAKKGDLDARNKLVTHNLKLVISVAKSYRGRGLDFMDLIQEGNIGLMTAPEDFDVARGV